MRQIKEAGFDFSSLYVGGGTTLINEPELEKTLKLAKDLFSIEDVSAESDPNHISPESLSRFDGLIDRLSVGVQSFDDETLKRVGRYEKFGSAKETKRKLEQAIAANKRHKHCKIDLPTANNLLSAHEIRANKREHRSRTRRLKRR